MGFKYRKMISDQRFNESSSEEDEAMKAAKDEFQKQQKQLKRNNNDVSVRKDTNPGLMASKKKSLYDSDTNGAGQENMNSTSASSNITLFKKLILDKGPLEADRNRFKRS